MPLILLAEEESSTIDHVRSALASQGWLVKTVGTRDQALRAASEFAPQLVLVNDRLVGADDLVRTFCRGSGGPGVILLTPQNGDGDSVVEQLSEVDAVLAKPLDTDHLIETIRQSLAASKDKPPTPPVAETEKVFSSEEIFGDLLDDILDEEPTAEGVEAQEPEAAPGEPAVEQTAAAVEAEEETVEQTEVQATAPEVEEPVEVPIDEPEPVAEEEPIQAGQEAMAEEPPGKAVEKKATKKGAKKRKPEPPPEVEPEEKEDVAEPQMADADVAIPVSGLEDLEEVVREGVSAWADSLEPEDQAARDEQDQMEALARAAAEAEEDIEPLAEEESEESMEARLEDTLAGVLADSLGSGGAAGSPEGDEAISSVDSLLSQALGGLDLGSEAGDDDDTEDLVADSLKGLSEEFHLTPRPRAVEPQTTHESPAETEASEAVEPSESSAAAVESAIDTESKEAVEEPTVKPVPETEPELVREEKVPSKPTLAVEPVEFGEYTLEKQIGVGGMASVWKARRKGVEGFEKRVAIKKILPQAAENEEFVEMFIDEAKLAAQLNHNNITHIYDLGRIDEDYFIAMEYVEGRNLRQLLDQARKKEATFPIGVTYFIVSRVADALDYAHRSRDFDDTELGLVHRDVSPQNVLISYEGDIKLCDFGIAKAVSKISTTQMGALKGKLQYMSPEQAWGKTIDHRSDIFSLGSLLFELLTNRRLFTGDSEMAVLEAVREAEVGSEIIQSASIPAGAKGLLLKALAKEPENRYESAAEFQQGLEELIKQESPTAGAKTLASFVRELLDLDAESEEEVAEDKPVTASGIDEITDLEWEATAEPTADETEKSAWLRRLLTRLLPVILVVAIGGGIIAGLMQRESPATADQRADTSASLEAMSTSEAPAPAEDEEGSGEPQGQPPPAAAEEAETTPAPPPQTTIREPEPEAEPEPSLEETAPSEEPLETEDSELDRKVEEELQRVQELMDDTSASDQAEEVSALDPGTDSDSFEEPVPLEEPVDEATDSDAEVERASDPVVDSFSLETLWSDVAPAEGSVDDSPTADAQGDEADSRVGELAEPGPGVVEPRLLEFAQPEYTEEARQAGATGTVRVSVLVDESGSALEVRLVEGLNQSVGLEEAVIESARNAVYSPATRNGVPVKMWYEVRVLFEP